MAKKIGRPSSYTKELGDKICELIALGNSMRTVCAPDDMPSIATVFKWMRDYPDFLNHYARATKERTEAHNEKMLDIGDDSIDAAYKADPKAANAVVSAYKLKADNLKWVMSKMQPKKYGDKLDLTSDGKALPTPILGGATKTDEVSSNNSSSEDTGA